MTTVRYMSLNGRIVPAEDAKIHVLSPALKYAACVFEGIRGYWNDQHDELFLFRLEEHLRRLQYSMKVMRFGEVYSVDYVKDCIIELIQANGFKEDTYVRLFTFVDEPDGEMDASGPVGMAIAAKPRGRQIKKGRGLHCAVGSWVRTLDNAIPARVKCVGNYVNSRHALGQAKVDGYDNVIIVTDRGTVSEGPGACFFMVRDGVPLTPGVTSDILESITRQTTLQIFDEYLGQKAVERDIGRTELYAAEEAFYCGTGHEILPIVSIDRHPLGTGDIGTMTQALHETYVALVRGEITDHPEWRTPVYGTG